MQEYFVLIVAIVALIYSIGIRKLQFSIGNQTEMQALQKETKSLNEEYKKAAKDKNESKMQTLMKQQQDVLPKMGKLMMGQFKVMGVILVLYLGLMGVLTEVDPFKADDAILSLVDNGSGCDYLADDGIYSACYQLTETNYGSWVVTANAYQFSMFESIVDGLPFIDHWKYSVSAQNSSLFIYKEGELTNLPRVVKGDPIGVSLDKEEYSLGDTVKVTVTPSKDYEKLEAVFNKGTWFYVDLPFTIPIVNIKRINEIYYWFILISILSGLIITPIYKKIYSGGKDAEAKE